MGFTLTRNVNLKTFARTTLVKTNGYRSRIKSLI
jgi:hypothetical protein